MISINDMYFVGGLLVIFGSGLLINEVIHYVIIKVNMNE